MKKLALITGTLFFLFLSTFAQEHKTWDNLLRKYVAENGDVNYKGLKKEEKLLDHYLQTLSEQTPKEEWTSKAQMAYWINSYNAFTVKLILNHYPIGSIKEIEDGEPWDFHFIELGNREYSLNEIEHEILRPKYKDARIHFAVNCASISCPKLYNRAFTAENIEESLDLLAKAFINNEEKNSLSASAIEISKIFEWYIDDFHADGSLIDFLNHYSAVKINQDAEIAYKTYNWELNKQ